MDCDIYIEITIYAFWVVLIVCTIVFLVTMGKLFFSDKYTAYIEQQLKECRDEQKKYKES